MGERAPASTWALLAALLVAGPSTVGAEEKPQPPAPAQAPEPSEGKTPHVRPVPAPAAQAAEPPADTPPLYRPPRRGAPRARLGGGARGSREVAAPLALAPEHVGLTIAASPSLFWFLERIPPPSTPLILTLSQEDVIAPLAEVTLPPLRRAGIQRVRLGEHAIELEPGVEYMWSISLVRDPDRRSLDLISSGFIRRSEQPPHVEPRSAHRLAELGFWYDALEAASDALAANPASSEARRNRDALLRQVGLHGALGAGAAPEKTEPR